MPRGGSRRMPSTAAPSRRPDQVESAVSQDAGQKDLDWHQRHASGEANARVRGSAAFSMLLLYLSKSATASAASRSQSSGLRAISTAGPPAGRSHPRRGHHPKSSLTKTPYKRSCRTYAALTAPISASPSDSSTSPVL